MKALLNKIFSNSKENASSNNSIDIPILRELNNKQKEAVLAEDRNLLILAGAGSGKTKTLIQKILYLLSKGVDSSEILAITFTKNATNEMIDRLIINADSSGDYVKTLNNKNYSFQKKNFEREKYLKKHPWISNMTVKTFHSLCYSILRDFTSIEEDNKFRILTTDKYLEDDDYNSKRKAPETPYDILDKIIKEICSVDKDYLIKLKRHILDYYVEAQRLKINRKSKEPKYEKPYIALDGTQVRSPPERDIADWLFLHNIKYEYEPLIALKNFEQNPDFYIHSANLFLEHVSNSSYPMQDKEKEFLVAGKKLIKTYQTDYNKNKKDFYQILESLIFPILDKDFETSTPLILENAFEGYYPELTIFKQTILSVIDSLKVENKTIDDIYEKSKQEQKRIFEFYELATPIIKKYLNYCHYNAYVDFNDIIIKAVNLIKTDNKLKDSKKLSYKYILVDEFQDVNTIQVELLKELIGNDTQLFCVGDDWQSIYGWRGSEVDYIVNFQNYFQNPTIIKLDINYRSNDTIVAASNEVIKNNKFKIEKEIKAINNTNKKIYLYEAKLEEEDGVEEVLEQINKLIKNGFEQEDILILYRRTTHIQPYNKRLREVGLNKVQRKTIHASKGLEAKIVFIVGLKGGIYGFPNVYLSDRIFQLIKKSDYELLEEEERRLFYVALTRAKEYLFLISELGNRSIYINEIPGNFIDTNNFLLLNVNNNEEKKKICYNCSKEIKSDFMFCPYCGKENNELAENKIENSNEESMNSLSETLKETYELFLNGNSVLEIANIRNLKIGTIGEHLFKLYELELIDVIDLINVEKRILILNILKEKVDSQLKEIKERLPKDIEYFEIKIIKDLITKYPEILTIDEKKFNSQKLKEIKEKYPNAYEKWSSEEESKLVDLYENNLSISEIAKILERKPGGIRARLKKLNIIE